MFSSCGKFSIGAFLVSTLLLGKMVAPARADIVLVDAHTAPCPIVADSTADPLALRAAGQLAIYLSKISGRPFAVTLRTASEPLPRRAIVIGASDLGAADATAVNELGSDGFILKTNGEHLTIAGGGDGSGKGVFYGVFDFLQRELGCRWWSWNEEDVPSRGSIELGDIDVREKPAFKFHDILSQEAQTDENNFEYKERAKATLQFTGNHTMQDMLAAPAREHPEFWPMNAMGVRANNNTHFNYLAPGIDKALADGLAGLVKYHNGDVKNFIYFAGQGDYRNGLDQSEESKHAYAEDGPSGPLVGMMNRTGAILAQRYPGIQVGTFAYMATDPAPKKTVPGPNVNIWLPRLRYGTTLGIEEAATDRNPDEASRRKSEVIKASIEKWAQIAPGRLYIWDYGANYEDFTKPWPSLRAMADDIKYYHRLGIAGILIQSNYVAHGGDLAVLKNWIWSRLLWNPDQNVDILLKQFCDGYYGPASAAMQDYVNTLEDSVRVPRVRQLDEFFVGTDYLTPTVMQRMLADLDTARRRCGGERNADYQRRVNEAGASIESIKLWTWGQLAEKHGRLIRTDIDPEHGGAYTHDRAVALMTLLRGSGQDEDGAGAVEERPILAANGGPVYVLRHGHVAAHISPYSWGALWSLQYDGRNILRASNDPGSGFFVPVGTPSNEQVEMDGDMGLDRYNTTPIQVQHESYTQDADGVVHDAVSFTQKQAGAALSVSPLCASRFPAEDETTASRYRIEMKCEDGWAVVPMTTVAGSEISAPSPIAPVDGFVLRVVTPDNKLVTESYDGPPATGLCAVYSAKDKALYVDVQLGPIATAASKTVPGYTRSFWVSEE